MAKACSGTEIHINIQAHCVHHVKHQSKIQTREWRRGHGLRDWKEHQRTSDTARGSGQRAEGRAHGHCSTSPNDSSRSPLSPRSWCRWTPVAELLPGRAQRPPCRWHRVCPDSRSVFTTSPSSRYAATRNLVTLPRGRLSSRIPTSAAVPHPFTDPSPCPALRSPLGQIRRANIASEKRHLKLRDQGHHHRQHVFTRKQTCGMESNPGNLCFPRGKSWLCHGDGTQKPTPPKPGTRKMGEGSFSHGVIERLIQKDATHATCWASS